MGISDEKSKVLLHTTVTNLTDTVKSQRNKAEKTQTILFNIYEIQEQAKPIYGKRNQNSSYLRHGAGEGS